MQTEDEDPVKMLFVGQTWREASLPNLDLLPPLEGTSGCFAQSRSSPSGNLVNKNVTFISLCEKFVAKDPTQYHSFLMLVLDVVRHLMDVSTEFKDGVTIEDIVGGMEGQDGDIRSQVVTAVDVAVQRGLLVMENNKCRIPHHSSNECNSKKRGPPSSVKKDQQPGKRRKTIRSDSTKSACETMRFHKKMKRSYVRHSVVKNNPSEVTHMEAGRDNPSEVTHMEAGRDNPSEVTHISPCGSQEKTGRGSEQRLSKMRKMYRRNCHAVAPICGAPNKPERTNSEWRETRRRMRQGCPEALMECRSTQAKRRQGKRGIVALIVDNFNMGGRRPDPRAT